MPNPYVTGDGYRRYGDEDYRRVSDWHAADMRDPPPRYSSLGTPLKWSPVKTDEGRRADEAEIYFPTHFNWSEVQGSDIDSLYADEHNDHYGRDADEPSMWSQMRRGPRFHTDPRSRYGTHERDGRAPRPSYGG